MANLHQKIISIYPALASDPAAFTNGTITLRDDGDGPYIETWQHPELAKPTDDQIAAASDVVPPPVPSAISDRQFFQQLAIEGTITNAEALAAVKVGTIPAVLQAFVDSITDPAARFSANMVLAGATTFERLHPMSEAIRMAQGRTEAQRDEFFTAAAAL